MAAIVLKPPLSATQLHRALLLAAAGLALLVVGLGAFVRLSDAGLGCPDWPGCYGQLIGVPASSDELTAAAQAYPGQTVHAGKAWKEMIHRYAAGILGLLVLGIAATVGRRERRLASAENGLLALIVVQAALGMWTVTLLLKPLIVVLHLLGGMVTWATLVHLLRRAGTGATPALSLPGRFALAVVVLQVALGGWVSSQQAALACVDFPACRNGHWWPATDFGHGFTLLGENLSFAALTAIHLAHRLGALLVVLAVTAYGVHCWRQSRRDGALILGPLLLQLGLGIANVLLHLPLPLAVAHNLGAALLLGALVWVRPLHATAAAPPGLNR